MLLRYWFCFLISVLPLFATSQMLWQITGDRVTSWNYAWGDEFSGNEIDNSKWDDAYPWGRSLYCSNDNHYYTQFKNCEIRNGLLRLVARKEKITARAVPYESDTFRLICNGKDYGKNLRTFEYTCGMIFSKKKFQYGYYEIRFKSQDGKGMWPAFWLYAGNDNEEIDIFEINGSRNTDMHVDVHCPKGCKNYKTTLGLLRTNWGDYLTASVNWNSGFNVVGAEWQPDYIKWFLNGQPVAYWKGNFQHPMWIIAAIGLSRDGGAFGPGPDAATVFPAYFDVDYIRYWSAATANQKITQRQVLESAAIASSDHNAVLKKGTKPESKKKIINENSTFLLFSKQKDNSYTLEVSGDLPENFSFEAKNEKGKVAYSSNDASKRKHEFSIAGEGNLKIQVNGKQIEQTF